MSEAFDTRIRDAQGTGGLHVHYRLPESGQRAPLVVMCHGFSVDGTESHRMFLEMAREYQAAGMAVVLFDQHGCGYSDGDFEEFSFERSVADLGAVVEWSRSELPVDPRRIIVHGQSLGTAIATVQVRDGMDVAGVVLWNLSADLYNRYLRMLGPEILDAGVTCIDKGLYVRRELLDELRKYDIVECFIGWSRPVLFINSGADDLGVPALSETAAR